MMKHTSIRVLLTLVNQHDLELEQMDAKTAILHGNLEEKILMAQLEDFFVKIGDEDKMCHLRKSLYGLKQFPRQWYLRFDKFMVRNGFSRSNFDSCVYVKWVDDSGIFLLLYVDDMLITSKNKNKIHNVLRLLGSEFEMKDMEPAKKILGMEITRDAMNYLCLKAQLQPIVALSTTKAEYIATTEGVKESLRLKGLIDEFEKVQNEVVLFCDNQSVIHLTKNQMFHESTKHIDIKLHFIQNVIVEVYVVVEKVHTDENPMDMATKMVMGHC
ncbi:hypothetical protein AXG93_702s1240 [Marchantia polymorpha subsp. ruderalis]|uniref:Reverse transcriptase Ty1/copia-type domain-containing protein n=1 Tax=Marchantia polymorpha subsp. ruderalis TaxID=1480154 RepID=A0A176W8Z5_MARPO|nr:hypothetical protein AXG93_702s1240 [Marchantia polymorpha subsp. ruderalis]